MLENYNNVISNNSKACTYMGLRWREDYVERG